MHSILRPIRESVISNPWKSTCCCSPLIIRCAGSPASLKAPDGCEALRSGFCAALSSPSAPNWPGCFSSWNRKWLYHKVGSRRLFKMSVYVVALRFPLIGITGNGSSQNRGKQPRADPAAVQMCAFILHIFKWSSKEKKWCVGSDVTSVLRQRRASVRDQVWTQMSRRWSQRIFIKKKKRSVGLRGSVM